MRERFYADLKKVYALVATHYREIYRFYDALDGGEPHLVKFVDEFLEKIGLKADRKNRLAAVTRLAGLRDDLLVQSLKESGVDDEVIIKAKEEAYLWVADFWVAKQKELILKIESAELLTPFYRELLRGVHEVGVCFSAWQTSWTATIINGVNRELYRLFNGDEEKIFEMLNRENLLDPGASEERADRCYSVLRKSPQGFESIAYAEAFKEEVQAVVSALETFVKRLMRHEDEVFGQKEAYVSYLEAIILALKEPNTRNLLKRWADVDRRWMAITAPLQIGHPLEYYEDHYRKAVALEWDLRIIDPSRQAQSMIFEKIKAMFVAMYDQIGKPEYSSIYDFSLLNLGRVQLYLGRPALVYGAEFNGIFSAQVVPNDETVSRELGKKIFAFADMVLESARAKPFMKITREVFGEEFTRRQRELLFKKPDIWYRVYEITTIGHEYGHILWMDETTESRMNASGQFKNVEEFKATASGLMAFFMDEQKELRRYVLEDTIKRAVGLIAWMETDEVLPYYTEGLLHLCALFESGVLDFDGKKLFIDLCESAFERVKGWYWQTYQNLAEEFYLPKKDAALFLERFVAKRDGVFLPKNRKVRDFVEYYWELHQKIGRVVDETENKKEWLS